jgi:hypothetical protein
VRADPSVVDEARYGLTGLNEKVAAARKTDVSIFEVGYQVSGVSHSLLEGRVLVFKRPSDTPNLVERANAATQYFGWNTPPIGTVEDFNTVELMEDTEQVGYDGYTSVSVFSTVIFIEVLGIGSQELGSEFFQAYMYCISRIQSIDMGINWLGYPADHVPPWSADHLYQVARDLCNRALEAEARVLSLTEALEQALTEEFQAEQAQELATAGIRIAELQAAQSLASANLAISQAELSVQQNDLALEQNTVDTMVQNITASIGVGTAVGQLATGDVTGFVKTLVATSPAIAGTIGGMVLLDNYQEMVLTANTALDNAQRVESITASLGVAQVDMARLQASQAMAYAAFLSDLPLNSTGYEKLLGLAADTFEVAIAHATRVSWLAERALAHETRRFLSAISLDYGSGDELYDMTRAQRLTSDLEGLRATYTADESARRQQIKLVIGLSQLAPDALAQLRNKGECSFALTQRTMDLLFPGLYLHSLQDLEVRVVGLVPPDGVRGVLQLSSLSWVRVPNEPEFLGEGATSSADWTTTPLAATPVPAGSDTSLTNYAAYIMKQLISTGADLVLSAYRIERDGAILRAPQGLLTALQHHGLDTSLRLALPKTANGFDWANISDVEIQVWFLAAYDDGLAAAQREALWRQGKRGEIQSAALARFPVDFPAQWAVLQSGGEAERLDLRTLTFDVPPASPIETSRLLTNLFLAIRRPPSAANLPVRIFCDTDPVGVLLTISPSNQAYTAIGVSPTPSPPPNSALTSWLQSKFYSGSTPTQNPQQRFVLKFASATAGTSWWKKNADGVFETTTSGPLKGTNNGLTPGTANYNGGASFLNVAVRVKVAHKGGTMRLRARGTTGYAVELSSSTVRLFKNTTELANRSLAYPSGEFVLLELWCWNQASGTAKIQCRIDGIVVLEANDATPVAAGTVGIQIITTVTGPVPVELDDLEVVRLTGLGVEAEQLLFEPFTTSLPSTWSFPDGTWTISTNKHNRLDLSTLLSVGLKVDYQHELVVT